MSACPACCYSPQVPPLRSPYLRDLVARFRALEISQTAGRTESSAQAGGYIVCIDGQPVGRVGHPSQVTCHYPAATDFDYEPDMPVSGLTVQMVQVEAEVADILRRMTGEAGDAFTEEDYRERGIDNFPEVT